MRYINDFSKLKGIEEDGGKGHHLKMLTSMGFNVPEGVVIGASFYAENYPASPEFDYRDEAKLQKQCGEMAEKVEAEPLNLEFREEITKELKDYDNNTRFAVRSSSTFEDLAGAAFAGQHETYLNVSKKEIEEKVRKCFASLWNLHAVLYRNYQGFEQKSASMAVVIQRMVKADSAGVAFSVDPVSGNLDYVLIEGNIGLGESVVGGEAVTDSWIVDSKNWDIVERRVHNKEEYTALTDTGIEKREIPEELRDKPCLTDEEVITIAKTVKKIEEGFTKPQDVEWAFENGALYILQARPQTIIPPHFTRDESAERFPEPLTPLTWSYVEETFNFSLEYSLNMMNITLPTRPWFAMKNNYVYGNQNAVRILAMHRFIDIKNMKTFVESLTEIINRFWWLIDLPDMWDRDLDKFLVNVGRLSSVDFEGFSITQFQNYFKELFDISRDYFKPNIAISMTQGFLTKTLHLYITSLTGDPYESENRLKKIITATGTKTSYINREIYDMAQMVKNDKKLYDLFKRGSKETLKSLDDFPEFKLIFNQFIMNYGHREITFDYYKPTWAEAPEVVLDLVFLTASSNQEDPKQKELEMRVSSLKASKEILEKTPEELYSFISEIIRLTKTFTYMDDLEHFQTTRINLIARRAAAAFGEKLVKNGCLEDKYDLFFLTKDEIETLKDFKMPADYIEKISARKKEYFNAFNKDPIWDLNQIEEFAQEEGDVLKGVPGSPGECEGEIYLVHGSEDFANMPADAIIVARTTNPAWTPLFYKARGLITESGGPLSHGAVTARELGLPAVMCIRNALKIFNNGEKVKIDGRKGIVLKNV